MARNPTIFLHFKDKIGLSDYVKRGRTLIFSETLDADDGTTPNQHVKDLIGLVDSATVTKQHWLSHIVPELEIYAWDPNEVNPSGNRHKPSGHAAFLANVTELGYLDFGDSGDMSPGTTNTRVLTIKVPPQSGVFGVTNLRLWLNDSTGLGNYPEDFSVNFDTSQIWVQGSGLASGIIGSELLSTTLPAVQNIERWDGSPHIDSPSTDGRNPESDENTSEFVYLSVNYDAGFGVGHYGSGVSPTSTTRLEFRISYDYYIGGFHYNPSGVVSEISI